jgi:hypothetical protein
MPLLACRFSLRLLWPCCNGCTPVQHGWSMARTTCAFSCGGMLWAFVQYPPITFGITSLSTCWGCTTHCCCCSSLCRGHKLLSLGLHRVALAITITSLHTIPLMFLAKDTPASMAFVSCVLLRLLGCCSGFPLAIMHWLRVQVAWGLGFYRAECLGFLNFGRFVWF